MALQHRAGKFAILLHADVAGSTSLVQQNEHLAHERIQTTFRRFGDTIARYHGRVRELRGDALLAEFERASDAVTAALAFQADQAKHNKRIEDDIRPTVRVGIAMGEVVFADRTVTGAGVVLAQRMEQLAEPGGICITAAIHESLPQRMPFDQQTLGEQDVKGFDEPVRVYSVRLPEGMEPPGPAELSRERYSWVQWVMTTAVVVVICGGGLLAWHQYSAPEFEPVSPEAIALPLPDKPSIAVLPFDDLSPKGSDRYLADAITETLIATLGQVPELFVIARNSAFTYKDQAVDVRQVGRELGVRHVLEGSLQPSGDRIRVTTQLIDATTGEHLWAERYDQPIDDFFALQDAIALKVVVSLQGELTEGADAALRSASTENVQAYLRFQKALSSYFRFDKDAMIKTRKALDEALVLDPRFASPRLLKAWTHLVDARNGYSESRSDSLAAALAELKALESIGVSITVSKVVEGEAAMVRAWIALLRQEHDLAIEHGRKTVALIPNHADMLAAYGWILHLSGQQEESIESFRRAIRLNPKSESWQKRALSLALTLYGDHDEAVAAAKESIDRAESDYNRAFGHMVLAVAYADQGSVVNAKTEAKRGQDLAPYMTLEWFRSSLTYRNETDLDRVVNALRLAEVP